MSDNEKRKPKVFLKKNNEKSVDKKDDFYEYDKVKSKVDTLDEEFFENLQSIDYDKEKLDKEDIKEDIIKDESFIQEKEKTNEPPKKDEKEEKDENLNDLKDEKSKDEEDDDDDFGEISDLKDEDYDYEIKRKSFVNVEQRSNYYKEDEFEEDIPKKKRKKRKNKSKLKSFFKFLILALFALIAMAVYFGLTHDLFKIDYISIKGNVINEKEIISAKSGVNIGDNIFLTRKSKIKKNLKQISTIESVDVRKNYPNILEIDIKENYVSAYINTSDGIITVDNFGKIKNTSASNDEISGIQLKGLKETNFKLSDSFSKDDRKVNLLLNLLSKSYYNDVSSIDFSDEKKIVFELKNSIKVSFGSLDNYEKKLKVLSVLLKKIQTDGIKATEIILDVGKNPIIVKKS